MTELKREYVVPLRRKVRFAPKWRRSKKAVSVLKEFIKKHMKTDTVILCSELNEYLWQHGAKNPPGKLNVIALKGIFGGSEKTLVNLAEYGVDEQTKVYANQVKAKAEKAEALKEEIKDAEVSEKPKEVKEAKAEKVVEADAEEKKAAKKTTKKAKVEDVKNG